MHSVQTQKRSNRLFFWLVLSLLLLIFLSIFIGRYSGPWGIAFINFKADPLGQKLILNLRLPRVLIAVLLGASLAAAGTVFQIVFSNPLVEPGFLGVSQGAAFGAAFSIIYISGALWAVQLNAVLFAFLGIFLSYMIARKLRFGGWILRLIMAGIAISALFSSGVGILKLVADPLSQLPDITYWMMGGLWSANWRKLLSILPVVLIGLTLLLLLRWRLNLLSLNDQSSFSLGLSPNRERLGFIVLGVAVTASVISVAGIVSWVGLIVPLATRRLFGSETSRMLPASILLGAIFTLICDNLSRTLFTGEIPLGILTSLIGAAVFLILLSRQKRGIHV